MSAGLFCFALIRAGISALDRILVNEAANSCKFRVAQSEMERWSESFDLLAAAPTNNRSGNRRIAQGPGHSYNTRLDAVR